MKSMKSNMYEGVKTWNPLGGECPHHCSYCSTLSLKRRYPVIREKYSGEPRLYKDVLARVPKTDKTLFVCGQSDLFAQEIPTEYILQVLDACRMRDNTYLFQTKNPVRMKCFATLFPERSILCTTIETNRWYPQMGNTPAPAERAEVMGDHRHAGFMTQITIEPIMDFDLDEMIGLLQIARPQVVAIGADSKRNKLPEPSKEKLLALIDELKRFTAIVRKTNLDRLLK